VAPPKGDTRSWRFDDDLCGRSSGRAMCSTTAFWRYGSVLGATVWESLIVEKFPRCRCISCQPRTALLWSAYQAPG
jgi:hypothetical protein